MNEPVSFRPGEPQRLDLVFPGLGSVSFGGALGVEIGHEDALIVHASVTRRIVRRRRHRGKVGDRSLGLATLRLCHVLISDIVWDLGASINFQDVNFIVGRDIVVL